ncbi:MAG: hypothetical protein HFH60_08615 [Lachnospiraceae bacterium]|nr:hypothetical protein [Lachnospiraceae bacterium]
MKIQEEIKSRWEVKALIMVFLVGLSIFLLGEDCKTFLVWWMAIWIMGCMFMPLTGMLFAGFRDKGWLFSKVIAIAVTGYAVWAPVTLGALKFTSGTCQAVVILCIAANLALLYWQRRHKRNVLPGDEIHLIFGEEVILYLAFLLWTYVAGFHPQAHGVEKFMDYGFMEAMMRSVELPATDMWYSQEPMNYYYGGQYYAVFLTKLTGTRVSSTYHLMRTLVAGMAFALPFSIVRQVTEDYYRKARKFLPVWAGLLAGVAVSLSGNMHYIIYGKILPWLGKAKEDYWFPSSTRYIGHDPENMDRTIHEFPSYSFILGDLHAHVVNVFFVLTVVGLLYAWMKRRQYDRNRAFLQWPLLMCGVFLGIFQWTNTWDFAIYYVVACGVCFFGNLARFRDWKKGLSFSVAQWVQMLLLGIVMALPFTLQFDSSMAQGVRLTSNHSALYQYCILWGFPVILVGIYLLKLFLERGKCPPLQWLGKTRRQDVFIAVLCLCALGLIVLPELVYVRDIYEETSARSNTMFKLTYQAFILFGISLGFILIRFWADKAHKWVRAVGVVGIVGVLLTAGYTVTAVKQWNGRVWDRQDYQGLNATAYLEDQYPQDAPAIRWLQENVKGDPVVLEANGDSYSDYCRVSAMTGLPTILGWYTHEWLWRENTDDLNEKSAQIERIYTSADQEEVQGLLEEYQVEYIFVGQMEREKYPALNEALLRSLGEAVFDDESLIIHVDDIQVDGIRVDENADRGNLP